MPVLDRKFFFHRDWFVDSVGRNFGDKEWENFVKSMDEFIDQYIKNLENIPEETEKA